MGQNGKHISTYIISKIFQHKIAFVLIALAFVTACSSSKDKFINRTYHNTTTVYNVLYNGNNSLDKAEEIIVKNYNDDFRETLPVSPFEVGMNAMKARSHLQKADEKASKAIQKHSMNIGGNERNSYMDEAYLLLGKARYYQSKFLPALEAFNYIKLNFRGGEAYYNALLWSARTQIELENYSLAVVEINELLDNPNLSNELKPELYAYYSDALLQQKKYGSSIKMMKKAIELEKDKRVKTRYTYIMAQIYKIDGRGSMSTRTFDEVIKKGTPYKYVLHAKLDRAENFDPDIDELKLYVAGLEKMLGQKKNEKDIEKIYYQLGNVYYKDQYYEKAEKNLKISIAKAKSKKYEKGVAYELLGNVYFDQAKYKYAAAYYDSTLTSMSKSYKNYKNISRKRKQLNNVIKFINIAERNDSILKIVAMSEGDRVVFFEKYIVRLKEEEARRIAEAEAAAKLSEDSKDKGSGGFVSGRSSTFYLYNPVTLQYGRSEFEKRWGDRPLQDQWRILSKPVNTLVAKIEEEEKQDSIAIGLEVKKDLNKKDVYVNPLHTVDYYTNQLPTNADTLDVMKTDRDFAYYALGLIYNEQFGKYELSSTTLKTLLEYNPDEDIKLPTYYYLYKNYKTLGYRNKEKKYKEIILNDFPDSRYASIILNPEKVNLGDKQSVQLQYENLIKKIGERKFREAILVADNIIENYPVEDVIPKVELIKALAVGKLGTPKEYENALEYVMYNFPNDEVSEKSKKYLDDLKKDNKRKFDNNNIDKARIVIYADMETDFSELKKSIDYKLWQKKLKTSESSFSYNKNVFVVFNFQSWKLAEDFKNEFLPESLINKTIKSKNIETFIISQYNFNILQRKKNIDSYLLQAKSIENN